MTTSPASQITFADLWLSQELLDAITKKWYITPSPIQSWVIPLLINWDKDIIWQAATGTWKTAAFWLPLLDRLDPNGQYTQSIVMTPTRELAIQVANEIKSFATWKKFNLALLYGWQSYNTEIAALRKKPQIVVWTPWRIKDHLNKRRLDISKINYFILDEADEMLNVWFKEEIDEIMQTTPEKKKVLLFSATMPRSILDIAKKYMWDYDIVSVKSSTLTNSNITQKYYSVDQHNKFDALCRVIETDLEQNFYWIIFCQRKLDVDEVTSNLISKGFTAVGIHGDIDQKQRERILNRFKRWAVKILVATDVAARWIDVADLTHVINYSLPDNPETYTHRIGRTWRAWKDGIAISFVSRSDKRKLYYIENIIKRKIDQHQLPKVDELIAIKKRRALEKTKEFLSKGWLEDYHEFATELLTLWEPQEVVAAVLKKLYKDEFNASNYRDLSSNVRSHAGTSNWEMRLFVARWRESSLSTANDLQDFIKNESWISASNGKNIKVLDKFSYINLPEKEALLVLKHFKNLNGSRPVVVKAKENRNSSWTAGGYKWNSRWWYKWNNSWWYKGRNSSWRSSYNRESRSWWSSRGWYRGAKK